LPGIYQEEEESLQAQARENNMTEGDRITKRDEFGRILPGGKELSSDRARELVKKRWEKPIQQSLSTLLLEAGYSDPEEAPEHIKVLAEIAVSQRSGSVAALRDFRKLARLDREITRDYQPSVILNPGDICPTCNHPVLDIIEPETAKILLEILDRARKKTRVDQDLPKKTTKDEPL
jgi:hypothetical protein